jgi:DNA-binding transcriptional LysR family regulator
VLPKSQRLGRGATLEIGELVDTPLLLTRRDFASREWFDAACQVAHIRPRVLLESGAPSTLVALAQAAYGIAIVPSNVRIPRRGLRAVPLVQRGVPIGRWLNLAWDPRRFLAPYAEQFVEELVAYAQRASAKPGYTRRAPPLPRPKAPASTV